MARAQRRRGPESTRLLRPGPRGSISVTRKRKDVTPFGRSFKRQRTRLSKRFRTFTFKPTSGRFSPDEVVAIIRDHIKNIDPETRLIIRGRGGAPGGSPKDAAPQNRYWSSFAIEQEQLSTMGTAQMQQFLGLEGSVSILRITNDR